MTAVKLTVRHTCSRNSRVLPYRPRRRGTSDASAVAASAALLLALRNCSRKLQGPVLADLSMYVDGRGGVLEAAWMGGNVQTPGDRV